MFQSLWNPNVALTLVLIGLTGPALWLFWLWPSRPHQHVTQPHTPRIRYILTDAGGDGLWSPLLFSLPTSYGFSRTMQLEQLKTRRLPAVSAMQLPWLELSRATMPEVDGALDLNVAPRLREDLTAHLPRSLKVEATPSVGVRKPLWKVDARLAARGLTLPRAADADLPSVPSPWSVAAVLEIDANGNVRHVFLTDPHEDAELNAALVRILRQGRADANDSFVAGKVTVAMP